MATKDNNFAYLLIALIVFLVVLPVIDDFDLVPKKLSRVVAISILLIIGVWSLRGSGKVFLIGMTLVVLGVILNLGTYATDRQDIDYAAQGLFFAFLLLAILTALRQVLFDRKIDANRIYGAICIYLLLGVIWAVAYATLYSISPRAFTGATVSEGVVWSNEWVYYSFITLTTLGYGDILPISTTARAFAYSEAIFGVFYMAIMVAGIVSVYMSQQESKKIDQ